MVDGERTSERLSIYFRIASFKQFMDANMNDDVLVSLVNNGQTAPFAKVTDGLVNALASDTQSKVVSSFTANSATAFTVMLESVSIGLSAVDASDTLFGVDVADMQSGVSVDGNAITGTLKNLTGSNAITDRWGEGHFLCLQFDADDWTEFSSVMVGLDPSQESGLVEITTDPDKNGVFKITNKATQKFKVVATKDGETFTFTYDLSGLTVE